MTADEDRGDFLRRLAGADFCPPEEWVVAVNNRAGTTAVVSSDAEAGDAAEGRERVDLFAEGYWELTPVERRAEWEKLTRCTADAPTAAHLKHLERGLTVEGVTTVNDPMAAELAAMARELFTLRPRERAVRRMAWLDTRDRDVDWQVAVERLWASDSAAAELDPPLVAFLDDPSPPPTSAEAFAAPIARRVEPRPSVRPRRWADDQPPRSGGGGWSWAPRVGVGVAIAVIIGVIRMCAGGMSSNSKPYTPSYTPPPTYRFSVSTQNTPRQGEFTQAEVAQFEQYGRSPSGQPPERYYEWILARRPKGVVSPYNPPPTSSTFPTSRR